MFKQKILMLCEKKTLKILLEDFFFWDFERIDKGILFQKYLPTNVEQNFLKLVL